MVVRCKLNKIKRGKLNWEVLRECIIALHLYGTLRKLFSGLAMYERTCIKGMVDAYYYT